MLQQLEQFEKALADRGAAWVHRRDAADALGQIARRAIGALEAHRDDSDADVRYAVRKILEETPGPPGLRGGVATEGKPLSLGALVKELEKEGKREVVSDGPGYRVTVRLSEARQQTVYIEPHARKDGVRIVRVFTYCGPPSEEALRWALRANMQMVQSAVALTEREGQEVLVLVAAFFESEFTVHELKAAVKEVAHYGDQIEQRMTGLDEL